MSNTAENDSIHHFDLPCVDCHALPPDRPHTNAKAKRHSQNVSSVGEIIVDINKACSQSGCHFINPDLGHPVGVIPSAEIPDDMPLDQYSRITCVSCHDDKQESLNSRPNPYYLRQPPGKQLCGSCHQHLEGTVKDRSHWQFTTTAHPASDSESYEDESIGDRDYYSEEPAGIDVESIGCLSCHEELLGSIVNHHSGARENHMFGSMSNHPIGMIYEDCYIDNSEELQPLNQVDPQIRFVDGQVGCTSCHNLYNDQPYHLAVENNHNALCLSCHIK